MLRNSNDRYGIAARLLHWLMALLILDLLVMGYVMADLPAGDMKVGMYGAHKAIGVVTLLLLVLRLGWRLTNPVPQPPSGIGLSYRRLAAVGHVMLYGLMVLVPGLGIALSQAAGKPVAMVGMLALPTLVAVDDQLKDALAAMHGAMATLLLVVIAEHVAAALWHHFIRRDDVLRRMTRMPSRAQ